MTAAPVAPAAGIPRSTSGGAIGNQMPPPAMQSGSPMVMNRGGPMGNTGMAPMGGAQSPAMMHGRGMGAPMMPGPGRGMPPPGRGGPANNSQPSMGFDAFGSLGSMQGGTGSGQQYYKK